MHSLFLPFHLIILGDCRLKLYGGTLKQGVGSFKEVQISLSRDISTGETLKAHLISVLNSMSSELGLKAIPFDAALYIHFKYSTYPRMAILDPVNKIPSKNKKKFKCSLSKPRKNYEICVSNLNEYLVDPQGKSPAPRRKKLTKIRQRANVTDAIQNQELFNEILTEQRNFREGTMNLLDTAQTATRIVQGPNIKPQISNLRILCQKFLSAASLVAMEAPPQRLQLVSPSQTAYFRMHSALVSELNSFISTVEKQYSV